MLLVAARLLARAIDLMTMLVLARILAPSDFGLVAIAGSVVSVMEAALELPVNQALVRLPAITARQYDTAFTLSLLRGLALAGLLLAAAVPFAGFYADDRLIPLVCVLSIAPAARGLISPRLAEYQKEMSFWRDFALELGGKLLAFALGIAIAWRTGSYWAIAAGVVASPLAGTIGSYVLAPYRPRLSLSELKLFAGFVGWMSVAQIISALNWQFERLLLGKLTSRARLGLFTASSDVANIPFMALFGPLLRPLLAAFSRLRDSPERLCQSYLSASSAIVAVGLPLLVGESILAGSTVRLILGEQWLGAIPLVRWLALSLIPALLALPAGPLVMSFGATRLFVIRNVIELTVKLPIAAIGAIEFGFAGIIAARFAAELIAGCYSIAIVRRFTGLSARAQLMVSWRSAAATCAMVPPVLLCTHLLPEGGGIATAASGLLAVGSLGAIVYAGVLWLLWTLCGEPPGFERMAMNMLCNTMARLPAPRWPAGRGRRPVLPTAMPSEGAEH
jgi:PST family polysaccharide transporter